MKQTILVAETVRHALKRRTNGLFRSRKLDVREPIRGCLIHSFS
jgi:hypothetical protein